MANFTIRLKDVLQYKPANVSRETFLGLDDFPIFDEGYRAPLVDKIVNHYWENEIGIESKPLWEMAMRRKMHEIMPPFNELYESKLLVFDPMRTIDIRTISTVGVQGTTANNTTSNGSSTSTTDSTGAGRGVHSEFPQNILAGNEDYATSADDNNTQAHVGATGTATGTDTSTGSVSSDQNVDTQVTGFQGDQNARLAALRSNIINVDMLVVEELWELFMTVYGNNDTILPPNYNPYMIGYYL